MISGVTNIKSSFRRVDEITRVLAKYGLADWVGDITPGFVRRRFLTPDGTPVKDLPFEVRVRLAMTELGTTAIKLGQMMSTRADMVGPELATELAQLQADVPADGPDAVRATITSELGQPPEQIFAAFDYTPLASASIGQVHLAQLLDGTSVVVKVQHAGIEQKVRGDLSLLNSVAQLAENNSKEIAFYRPTDTIDEFKRSLLRELDFQTELNNILVFDRNFAKDPKVKFPVAYPEYSSRRVLTMERLSGYSIANTARMKADGVDMGAFAQLFANTMMTMIFRDGFYHADPHPGNVFVLPGGHLGMLDLGKVGRVDEDTRDDFINIVTAFLTKDVAGLTDELLQMCETPPDLNETSYRADVADFVGEFGDTAEGKLDIGAAFGSMFAIIRKHHLGVPPRVNMLLLVVVQTEGTARGLDPDFNLTATLQRFGADLIKKRFSPARLQRDAVRSFRDWSRLLQALPRETLDLIERAQAGELRINVEQRGIEKPINRLAYGIIASAVLLASALLWANSAPPTLWGISIFGVLGVVLAFLLGVHVLFLIWRSG